MNKTYALAAIVGCLLFFSQNSEAQTIADSLWMDEIRVQATRVAVKDALQAVNIQRIDSLQLQRLSATNLAGVLQWLTPVYVRDSGPGGLATFSSRGFSASQTQVIWNGFALNHPMLGVTDLTLIPSIAVQTVAISAGAANASFGDKGGGTIAIETKENKPGVAVQYSAGSFNTQEYSVQASTKIKDWGVGIIAGFKNAANNFTYSKKEFSNEAGGFVTVEKKRQNNDSESATMLLNVEKQGVDQSISSKLWVLDSRNQIPGGISSQSTDAYQTDGFVRWITRWNRNLGKHRLKVSAYVANQQLDYIDESSAINSLSNTSFQAIDVSLSSSLRSNLHTVGAFQVSRSAVESSEYPSEVNRNQVSLNLQSVWMPVKKLFIYPGIRYDIYSDFGGAYSASLGSNLELLSDQLYLKTAINRTFTTPTFNDLYWPALGNPDLDPETMVKAESSLEYKFQENSASLTTEFTVYQAWVENGIRWLPNGEGQSAPQNIESLDLRGIEFRLDSKIKIGSIDFKIGGSINQAIARISESRFENDISVGKQIIYTPEWQYKANTSLQFGSLISSFFYAFIDHRFTTSDHSSPFDPLPAYNTLDWVNSWSFESGIGTHSMQFAIRNAFNERYSVIRDYPMPGTHFKLTLVTNFK